MRWMWSAGQRPGLDEGKIAHRWREFASACATFCFLAGCSELAVTPPADGGGLSDASEDPGTPPDSVKRFCDLPGSLQYVNGSTVAVPGGPGTSAVAFLKLPDGFCAHYFAHVGNTRQLRFAPGGELFVSSPTTITTSNGSGGQAAIIVLPDDNRDGTADAPVVYASGLPSTQGLLFANDHFYFQDHTKIMRTPYMRGDRELRDPPELVVDINVYSSPLHWPKTLDQADDGTIYVGNGGDQDEKCDVSRPFRGGILKIDGSPNGAPVSKGFRNPINVRCEHGHNRCFATELSMDYTRDQGGREKLVPIRDGDDWGHPCCFARNVPAFGLNPAPDCSQMTPEDVSFVIGDTPFGVDFEPGLWPAPRTRSAFVVLHGAYGQWQGARVVSVEMNPADGLPFPGTSIPGTAMGAMTDFAGGWDDAQQDHGRPSAVIFAPDGRLFVGNDADGTILWIAPLELAR